MVDFEAIFNPQLLESIKFGLVSTGVSGLILVVLILAWISTGLPPLNYYVWLVQLQTLPARRIIQVFTINDESSGVLDTSLTETSQLVSEELNSNNPNSPVQNSEESPNQTTVVIIQPPSSITNRNPTANPAATFTPSVESRVESNQQQQPHADGEGEGTANYRFELPAESAEDINQIHRFLRANIDNAIATAATIALYNRRMNEQATNSSNNRLLVSSISMSIESGENHPTQNILISYDNLQPVASTHEETASIVHTNTSDSDSYTDEESSSSTTATGSTNHDSSTTDEEESEVAQLLSTNAHKGTVDTNQSKESDLTIRLKFLDDTQRLVKTWLTTTVGDFKRNNFADTLISGKVVRLIYQGQLLRDDSRSLSSYGIHDQCVVHCHVGNKPYVQAAPVQDAHFSNLSSHNNTGQQHNGGLNANTFGARLLSTGISWADILLLAVWNLLFSVYNWAQAVDNNNNTSNPAAENATWNRRAVEGLRRALRLVLNCLFDPTIRPMANADDPFGNRFNAGALIGLLFALKFLTMWLFVLYFPQFSNPSTIVLLTVLTVVMGSYFFFNRQMGGEGGNVQQIYHNH